MHRRGRESTRGRLQRLESCADLRSPRPAKFRAYGVPCIPEGGRFFKERQRPPEGPVGNFTYESSTTQPWSSSTVAKWVEGDAAAGWGEARAFVFPSVHPRGGLFSKQARCPKRSLACVVLAFGVGTPGRYRTESTEFCQAGNKFCGRRASAPRANLHDSERIAENFTIAKIEQRVRKLKHDGLEIILTLVVQGVA